MKVLKVRDGEMGFAFTITQTYFFVLLICGVLAFMFTGWFSYHNRREFPSLVKIIRFHAVRSDSDNDLENGRNDQWELDAAHSEEDDQAGWGYSDTESEDEQDPDNCCRFCGEYQAPGWSCSHNEDEDQLDWSRSTNEDEDPHDWSRFTNEGDALRLTPSSSGSDADANTSTARPPAFDNWYAAPDDTESCSSCSSEYARTIPWTRPAAHREPLTPTSPTATLAPLASDADADANAEDTDDHSTSAQEQRRRSTGTAFFPPGLPARRPREATFLADERGHGQRPGTVGIPRDVVRPLRITIPNQRLTYAEPRAPTTPVNTHSLAEWPSRAYARDGWRDE